MDGTTIGIIVGAVIGVIVIAVVLRSRQKQAESMPEYNGAIMTSAANYYKSGGNAIGGTLLLTDTKLIFQAHKFNPGNSANKIDLNLNQLIRVQTDGMNKIEVFDRYSHSYIFTVNNRSEWVQEIEKAIVANHENDILTEGGTHLVAAAKKTVNDSGNATADNDADKLIKLKQLKDNGIITETEYEEKRAEILKRM